MSPGFRRGGSHSTLGLVRETAKVEARTDTSGHPAGSDQHVVTSDRHQAQRQVHVGTFPGQQGTKSESRCSTKRGGLYRWIAHWGTAPLLADREDCHSA